MEQTNTTEIMVKMVLDRWNSMLQQCGKILDSLSDEQLQKEIAPGRNRGIYILGHLIAVHDDMQSKLNFGDMTYPELQEVFVKSPDKAVGEIPSVKELRAIWGKQNQVFTQKFESLRPNEWFEKHTAVSTEDFIKEPHRNKLNILITRTSHLSYHTGQLVLI